MYGIEYQKPGHYTIRLVLSFKNIILNISILNDLSLGLQPSSRTHLVNPAKHQLV